MANGLEVSKYNDSSLLSYVESVPIPFCPEEFTPGFDIKGDGGFAGTDSSSTSGHPYTSNKSDAERKKPPLIYLPSGDNTTGTGLTETKQIINKDTQKKLSSWCSRLFRSGMSYDVVLAAIKGINSSQFVPPVGDEDLESLVCGLSKKTESLEPRVISFAELNTMEVSGTRFIVENVIPSGLGFIVGRPKAGKSFLSLNLAIDIASGNKFLSRYPTQQGDVIYLALEDSLGRLLERTRGATDQILDNLYFATSWPRFDTRGRGMDWLEREIDRHSSSVLVVIDLWQMVRAFKKSGRPDYEVDYQSLAPLREMALERNMAILLVHHTTKQQYEDNMDSVLGSTAITGVADFVVHVERKDTSSQNQGLITVKGRDLPESISFYGKLLNHRWTWIGTADQVRSNENENKALAVLDTGKNLTEISRESGLPSSTVKDVLGRLMNAGLVIRTGKVYSQNPEPTK